MMVVVMMTAMMITTMMMQGEGAATDAGDVAEVGETQRHQPGAVG